MKRLGVFLPPPLDGMLVHRRVTPSTKFADTHYFFPSGYGNESCSLMVLSAVRFLLSLTTVTVTPAWVFFREFIFRLRAWKKINKLFTGLGSVRIVKVPYSAARGLRPRTAFSRPRSQFFTIRTSQPANKIHLGGERQCDRTQQDVPGQGSSLDRSGVERTNHKATAPPTKHFKAIL